MCGAEVRVLALLLKHRQGSRLLSAQYAPSVLQQRNHHLDTRHFCAGSPLSTTGSALRNDFVSPCSTCIPRVGTTSPFASGRHLSTCAALYASAVESSVTAGADVELAGAGMASAASGAASVAPSSSVGTFNGVNLTTFETSASAKWASDAASTVAELPKQGDLASLGLCANTPVGWLQSMIEYIHVHADLPWWGAIVASTLVLRAVIFPVMMKVQKNGVMMNNINPEIQKLMKKQREYRQMGNKTLSDQYSHKIWNVYQKHNCNPLKMAILPLIQLPLFLSFFIAIRKMAAVPVESMKTGGVLWFEDLTVADPYYILPVLACGSFVASIEVRVVPCMCTLQV